MPIREIQRSMLRYQTRADVLKGILRRRKSRQTLNFDAVYRGKTQEKALLMRAQRLFGSWDAAIQAAGIPLEQVRKCMPSKYPDRASVLRAIRARARVGLPVNTYAISSGPLECRRLHNGARKHFDNWTSALAAAGLNPAEVTRRGIRRYPTPASVVAEIRRRMQAGLSVTATLLSKGQQRDVPLYNRGREYFRRWKAAIQEAAL